MNRKSPFHFTCPKCGAKPGELCKPSNTGYTHVARRNLSWGKQKREVA